jgi:TonB family protein
MLRVGMPRPPRLDVPGSRVHTIKVFKICVPRGSVMRIFGLMASVLMIYSCVTAPRTQDASSTQPISSTLFQYEREYLRAHPSPAPAAPAPTGTSTILRPQLETGQAREGGVWMTTPGTGLTQYLTQVDWKIQQNWIPAGPTAGREADVVVRFRVLRTGQIRDIEIEKSSGSTVLDASALRAIQQSTPLPPFPTPITDPFLELQYRFAKERG